jgi:hypothetical protein
MTNRQKALGVTQEGYNRGIINDEFLANHEAFLAKAATVKKGQYKGIDLVEKWFGFKCYGKLQQVQPYLFGLTAVMPEHFNYSDTHGLDVLTVK